MKTKTITVRNVTFGEGGYDPSKPNNNITSDTTEQVVVPDEDKES